LPEGYFKMLVRQAYLRTHTATLDNFPIQAVQQCFSAETETITVAELNLTSLAGLDTMLELRNEVAPIIRLWLNGNQFETIQRNFCKSLHRLQEINLDDNKIATIPADFGQTWKYLQMVSIARNKLNHLTNAFGTTWPFFSFLNLNGNLLTELPNGFGQSWKNFSLIKLDNNKLSQLPQDLGDYWPTIGLINLENNPCSNQLTNGFIGIVGRLRQRGIKVLI